MFDRAIQAATPAQSGGALELLNGVALSPLHIETALQVLATLPAEARANPTAQALALQAYARDAGLGEDTFVSAALHARVTALGKWTAAHDPERQSNADAVISATSRFPLGDLGHGIGFEPSGFQEMVLFIEELPW